MKKTLDEFKKFALKGNMIDLAVGVIIGGAFTAIVTSLNKDILTPLLGLIGGTDFSHLMVKLGEGEEAPALMYGNFITAVINFLIMAAVVFFIVKFVNQITEAATRKEREAAEAAAELTNGKETDE